MGSAAHFGRIYWCGKRPAEEAYNGPFLSWVDLPANMSPAHPQVVKPLGITSGKIPDSAINATSERGNYEARNIRYVENPSFLAGPCLSWQSCVTLLRSRLFSGLGRLGLIISLRALPRRLHTRRALSMPLGQCTCALTYPCLL